ncbi:hypothetical protein GGF42_008135, partial [Coemansia sp. RSA 2424]
MASSSSSATTSSSSSFLSLASIDEESSSSNMDMERLYNYKSLSSLPLATTAAYIIGSGCHFVHTQAGPSIDAVVYGSSSRFTTRSQPVLGYSRLPRSAPALATAAADDAPVLPLSAATTTTTMMMAGGGPTPDTADSSSEPGMRIRLQQRPFPVVSEEETATDVVAAIIGQPSPTHSHHSHHREENATVEEKTGPFAGSNGGAQGEESKARRRAVAGISHHQHLEPPSLLLLSGLSSHSSRGFRNRKHDTAAGLLSKRPEYLRIFDRNSAQQIQGSAAALLEQPDAPSVDADDPPPPPPLSARSLASAGSSALATTNHLLLSGVNTEFDPALVFRRPSSSSLLASPDAAAAAALMFQPMFSPAAQEEEEEEEGEDGRHSNTGATHSDSLSFRTALSDLSEEDLSGEDLSEEEAEGEGKNDALWRASSCASSHDEGVGQAAHARASACLHGSSLAQLMASRGRAAPPPPPQVAAFHASPLGAGLVSPQSQRSVPVAEQARRARHPVYRLGALANATFEGGRHQDAFDLYSWALQLLSPAAGTTAQEMLATAAAAATTTPDKDGGCDGARRRASAGDRPRAWRQALSPASSTASVLASASASVSAP